MASGAAAALPRRPGSGPGAAPLLRRCPERGQVRTGTWRAPARLGTETNVRDFAKRKSNSKLNEQPFKMSSPSDSDDHVLFTRRGSFCLSLTKP